MTLEHERELPIRINGLVLLAGHLCERADWRASRRHADGLIAPDNCIVSLRGHLNLLNEEMGKKIGISDWQCIITHSRSHVNRSGSEARMRIHHEKKIGCGSTEVKSAYLQS